MDSKTETVSDKTQLNREEMITPQEAKEKKLEGIDHAMIRAFDEMIVHNYRHDSKEARVPQKEVIARYFKIKGVEETSKAKQLLFDNGWLDVEPLYRKAGWKVEYDKPGYNESYEAFFIFSPIEPLSNNTK